MHFYGMYGNGLIVLRFKPDSSFCAFYSGTFPIFHFKPVFSYFAQVLLSLYPYPYLVTTQLTNLATRIMYGKGMPTSGSPALLGEIRSGNRVFCPPKVGRTPSTIEEETEFTWAISVSTH